MSYLCTLLRRLLLYLKHVNPQSLPLPGLLPPCLTLYKRLPRYPHVPKPFPTPLSIVRYLYRPSPHSIQGNFPLPPCILRTASWLGGTCGRAERLLGGGGGDLVEAGRRRGGGAGVFVRLSRWYRGSHRITKYNSYRSFRDTHIPRYARGGRLNHSSRNDRCVRLTHSS